jgi:outer membrane protein assembly factor BamB
MKRDDATGNHNVMKQRRARYAAVLAAVLLVVTPLATALTGCGSGAGTRGLTGGVTRKKGSVTFSVRWPEQSRVIPIAAQSIVLTLDRIDPGPSVEPIPPIPPLTPPPPTQGNPRVTTVTVGDLELGTYRITATAFPTPDGSDTPLAFGTVDQEVRADETTDVSLTMIAEVRTVEVTPTTGQSLYIGKNRQLVATARNGSDEVVLVAPGAFTWATDNAAVATVDNKGLVSVVGAGTATITATYAEPFTPVGDEGTGSQGAAFVVGVANVVDGGLLKSAWPKFHGNAQNTGQASFGAETLGSLLWQYTVNGPVVFSSPAVAQDGTVYVGAYDGLLYALNANGTLKWTFDTGGAIDSSPAISRNGVIFVGSFSGKLFALNAATGALVWEFTAGGPIVGSPAIGPDDRIYIGATDPDNRLYALNPANGSVIWERPTGGGIENTPAISPNAQTLYFGSRDTRLYALNIADGTVRWQFATGGPITSSSPAVAQDGTIYVGSQDGRMYAIQPTGDAVTGWPLDVGAPIYSSPAIDDEGFVYFGTFDPGGTANNRLYSVEPNGAVRWSFQTQDGITSSPAIGLDGTVYFGSYDNNIYALRRTDGSVKWQLTLGDDIDSSPAIGPTGAVYIGGYNSRVFAIQ